MTETPTTPEHDLRVLDASALKALAHPLRVQIYDILAQFGPQTASTLAEMTGESSGSTSYHLRALAKHALIQEVEGRGTARERWWERPRGGISFTNPDAMKTPSGKAATQVVMTEFLNRRHQQLMQFVGEMIQHPEELENDAMISTSTARLTRPQIEALTDEIQAIIDRTVRLYRDQEGDDVRPVSIRTDIFPLPDVGA